MSTFSSLSPAMARLFERVDAAEPGSERLRAGYRYWQEKRRRHVLPAERELSDVPAEIEPDAFVFERPTSADEWTLRVVGKAARGLMRPAAEDWRLSAFGARRVAVRLRHLFDMAADAGEPLSGTFELDAGGESRWVEVLACPLETGEGRIGAVFGILTARTESVAHASSATR